PAQADGEDDGGDAEGPGEEVDADVPARVQGFPVGEEQGEKEGEGIVDEGDKDLEMRKRNVNGDHGIKRHPVSPVAVGRAEVPVGQVDGGGEQDEGEEGEEGTDALQDGIDVPFGIVLPQPASSFGGEEGSHGGVRWEGIEEMVRMAKVDGGTWKLIDFSPQGKRKRGSGMRQPSRRKLVVIAA
ncbi:MAG: hypothetical protein Q9210_006708, partial [Variospora velana]